nr:Serine threonine protein kinase-related domain containing protein [Haemonchus contortus]
MPPSIASARDSNEACSDVFKLDSVALNKQPEEVFDIIGKLGEGSYGSVHKAVHRETGHTLAIKKVPVDTDLQVSDRAVHDTERVSRHPMNGLL